MMNLRKGFTLIELIVVVAIIVILALIVVPKLSGHIGTAEKRTIQETAYNIHIVLQAEKSKQFDTSFPAVSTNAKETAYNDGASDISFEDILKSSGLNVNPANLKNLTFSDNTFTGFEYTDGKWLVKYDSASGGFGEVAELKASAKS